jgi:hypothetical protein
MQGGENRPKLNLKKYINLILVQNIPQNKTLQADFKPSKTEI